MNRALCLFFIFVLLSACSVKNIPGDPSSGSMRNAGKTSLFPLIANKLQVPRTMPSGIVVSKLLSREEAKGIIPDSLMSDGDIFYLSPEKFLTEDVKATKFSIYYKRHRNERTEKRLHAEISGVVTDHKLALSADNGLDSDALNTEFVNDSVFRVSKIHIEGVSDERDIRLYRCDSVVSVYGYDPMLRMEIRQRDSIRFFEERKFSGGSLRQIARTMRSEDLAVNNTSFYWNFITAREVGAEISTGGASKVAHFTMQLTNSATGKILLETTDLIDMDNIDTHSLRKENFKDVNFDGYNDFTDYSWEFSGSSGAYYNVWLYNPKKKKFEYCKEFSGGEIQADAETKTLSLYWKSGYPSNNTRIFHFGDKGKIKYTEDVTRELLPGTPSDKMITTYLKKIGKRTVKKSIDTTAIQN